MFEHAEREPGPFGGGQKTRAPHRFQTDAKMAVIEGLGKQFDQRGFAVRGCGIHRPQFGSAQSDFVTQHMHRGGTGVEVLIGDQPSKSFSSIASKALFHPQGFTQLVLVLRILSDLVRFNQASTAAKT